MGIAQGSYGFEPYAAQQIITRYRDAKAVTNSPNQPELGVHAECPLPALPPFADRCWAYVYDIDKSSP